jgi:hypothetical protein
MHLLYQNSTYALPETKKNLTVSIHSSVIYLSIDSFIYLFAYRNRQGSLRSLVSNGGSEDDNLKDLNPSQCFSINFRGDWTLDLMMLSGQSLSRDEILDALDQILQTYQEQKKRVSNDVLLLRYVWLDAISDKVRYNIPNLSRRFC